MLKISTTFSEILRIFYFDQFSRLFISKNWHQRALKFIQIEINLQCIIKDLFVANLRFPIGFTNKWPTVVWLFTTSYPIRSTEKDAESKTKRAKPLGTKVGNILKDRCTICIICTFIYRQWWSKFGKLCDQLGDPNSAFYLYCHIGSCQRVSFQ